MRSMMLKFVFQMLCLLFSNELALSVSEGEANNPVFNIDHTALEKNIAAIFNKVAHSSATTKRSVPAYEAQISQSATHSTSPSPRDYPSLTTSLVLYPMVVSKTTNPPLFRELPSYAPPSRALFTPPLPSKYANPFADKPTLRGTNIDAHQNIRRPVPPPSFTPAQERIPIRPPDFIEDITKNTNKNSQDNNNNGHDFSNKELFEMSDREKDSNDTSDYISSLHITSISRILLGSNGRKQDIPDILLKQISTKSPPNYTNTKLINKASSLDTVTKTNDNVFKTSTFSSDVTTSKKNINNKDSIVDSYYQNFGTNNHPHSIHNIDVSNNEKLPYPQPQPPAILTKVSDITKDDKKLNLHMISHPLEPTWKIALSLHVYLSAIMFTLIALYSVYKIVRFNDTANLLTQSYFLTIHLLISIVCTIRCFHLFYDAYNLGHSLPDALSNVLMFLPSSLLTAAFATLILYVFRCSTVPSLYQNKFWSPVVLILAFMTHIIVCITLYVSGQILAHKDHYKIFSLICQCIYIIICIFLGLCYMYVYRVIRSQLHISGSKPVSNHITTDIATTTLKTAINTTVITALLFILMGFVQLYGIFKVQNHLQPNFWLWWCWEFLVRLIELTTCSLLSWVASLSQYKSREKKIQQHVVHSGFALFPCGNSISTENMDDALYPAICSTNQAIQNYTIRTGKPVYDDSFPLNTLSEHLNVSNTFERRSTKKSGTLNNFPQEMRNSLKQRKSDTQSLCKLDNKNNHHTPVTQNIHEQSSTSGSTMLVAEDGFVRFRNLGSEEDDLNEFQNSILSSSDIRRNSITCSDRFRIQQFKVPQTIQNHQNSLPHLHLSHHRSPQQVYNNT